MNFNIVEKGTHPRGITKFHELLGDGNRICWATSWDMASCGVQSLYGFWTHHPVWNDPKALREFITWLGKQEGSGYAFQELYFSITDYQETTPLSMLLQQPEVRKLDKFYNKGHGPNHMNLYRLSMQKDFKYHENASAVVPDKKGT